MADPLAAFHPLVAAWFRERVGTPTDAQARAWPEIAAGGHVLVVAPTGSGKTLTAFLWALDRLLSGAWEAGRVRVLYVSPLKALNADIERNLSTPLAELSRRFAAAGTGQPGIRALTRSGDTPAAERRRLLSQPPEVLITTPESLNILLTSQGGRRLFAGLQTVILDEIHAVAGSKRGSHLVTAVDRLGLAAGEFQRVALSATVRPAETVAQLVAGFQMMGEGEAASYRPRPITVVRSAVPKRYDVRVGLPAGFAAEGEPPAFWEGFSAQLVERIRRHRSTLLFTNSRRLAEKVTRFVNEAEGSDLAYSHHGSLAKEVRQVVEGRLKRGELPALVATSSLELGIDIGDLDEVVLIQTPKTIASTIQRLGRAGHRVGEVSHGMIYPTFARDFLSAAVVARAVLDGDIEEVRPIANPLDVLAQVVLSMLVGESWRLDALFAFLRSTYPFRNLSRRAFDLVIEMLAGRYADSRLRELKARIAVDGVAGTARARPGVDRLLYLSGGTIPDRGYFTLRIQDSMARLGELDEEFVWERSLGDVFSLGAQSWRIQAITHNDVLVTPARGAAPMAPFWRADEQDRGFHLSERIARFLALADAELGKPAFLATLVESFAMEEGAAAQLVQLLERQRAATGVLPHRYRLVVERLAGPSAPDRLELYLHTFWGGAVNRPFSLALAAAWSERYPMAPIEVLHDDDCVAVALPAEADPDELLGLVGPGAIEGLLRSKLESTGFFGARFRENAGRALLLPRAGFRHRTPLWLNRQRAKKLLEAVAGYGDFPLVVETWRTCLEDELDLPALRRLLGELASGEIQVARATTAAPSPFAAGLVWKQTNTAMYDDDTPLAARGPGLRPDLLREVALSAGHRPPLPAGLVADLEARLQRLAPGYAPREAAELVEWVKERLLLPESEWQALVAAIERDGGLTEGFSLDATLAEAERRLVRVTLPAAAGPAVVALDVLPRLFAALGLGQAEVALTALGGGRLGRGQAAVVTQLLVAGPAGNAELTGVLAEWARFYGPFPADRLAATFCLDARRGAGVLAELERRQLWVIDRLREGAELLEICDTENLERLLRRLRAARRPAFEALPLARLPLFLAAHQGLTDSGDDLEALKDRLEQLLGFPAPAAAWEADFLPARLVPYYPAWLDSLLLESELLWVGTGAERLTFAFASDLDLLGLEPQSAGTAEEIDFLFAGSSARQDGTRRDSVRRDLGEIARATGLASGEVSRRLWELAWQGRASNQAFAVVRQGIAGRFRPEAVPERPARSAAPVAPGRRRFDRWQASRAFGGAWFPLAPPAPPADALAAEERHKERARWLLARYGIVFRELLARELPAFQWGPLFRALRLLELSGEVLAGYFFRGIPGPQFALPGAFRLVERGLPEDAVFWLNALDPASPCGLDLPELRTALGPELPRRLPTTYLAFVGSRLALVARRLGKELDLHLPPDHPSLPRALGVLKVLLTRQAQPLKSIEIAEINGEPAAKSPYAAALADLFAVTRDPAGLKLWRRY